MIAALVSGTLSRTPEQRTIRVKSGDESQFVWFVSFSETAQVELLRLGDGDSLSAQGALKAEVFEKDGRHRVSLSLVADMILALCQRPRERCAKPADQPTQDVRTERCAGSWLPDSGDPNDDIRF